MQKLNLKRLMSGMLILAMIVTCVPTYAKGSEAKEEKGKKIVIYDDLASEAETVTDSVYGIDTDINIIIKIEDGEKILNELKQIVDSIDKTKEINKDNIESYLKNIYNYMAKRDIYYKSVLKALNRIKNIKDPKLKKSAVIEFEKRYQDEKERDRVINHKIEKGLSFIKANSGKFTPTQKATLRRILNPLISKYYKHRRFITHVHNEIKKIKESVLRSTINDKIKEALKKESEGNLEKAKEILEQIAALGIADAELYKKIGYILKKVEGNGPKVFVGGKRPAFDVKPQILGGRTMVPFRAIANSLGVKDENINWNPDTRTITMIKGDKKIELKIGVPNLKVNGTEITIDVSATIVDGRTLVPARVVSECLDAKVDWDGDTKLVTIEDNFDSQEQNINTSNMNDIGLGTVVEEAADVTEEEAIDEIIKVDDSQIEADASSLDR